MRIETITTNEAPKVDGSSSDVVDKLYESDGEKKHEQLSGDTMKS